MVSDVLNAVPNGVDLLVYPKAPTISHLWAEGLRASGGELVAFTTSHFVPNPDWVSSIKAAHTDSPVSGIGGPIFPPRSHSPVSWAIYFQRYHRWLDWSHSGGVSDIPGDNSSYKRDDLLHVHSLQNDAFRELEANAQLLVLGKQLAMEPSLWVRQTYPFPYITFLRQRFLHGAEFGERRLSEAGRLRCWLFTAASPAIAVILFLKILSRVLPKTHLWLPFITCFPFLLLSILAWSCGETSGYLQRLVHNR